MAASELKKLANDLRRGADKADRGVPKAVREVSKRLKRGWALELRARSDVHAPALPYAVDYDNAGGPGWGHSEVGVNKGRNQGPLGNLLEYGAPARSTDAGKEGEHRLRLETPRFYRDVDDVIDPLG